MKKLKAVFILVGSISLILIVVIVAGWFDYTQKNQQSKTKTGITIDLKQDNSYPKISNFEVPILMYHYIRDASGEDELGRNLSVDPKTFDAQMAWLKENDFESVKLSDLADMERTELSKVNGEGGKPVVITFDDGYLDAYTEAFPVLKKYGFTGTFFIITNFIGKDNYMNSDQIAALRKAGMEIGSHTLTPPDLTDLESADVRRQLTESKDDTNVFCYPAGRYNDRVKDLVKEAGYVAAVTTKSGVATEDTKLFDLPRLRITNISAVAFGNVIEHALNND